MPNKWTGEYDDNEWEALLAQFILGGASAYHPADEEPEVPTWLPTDIAGCVLWLAADTGDIASLGDGDAVATWDDQSDEENDVTQSTAAKKPTYKTGIVNSKAVVRFDGGDCLIKADLPSLTQPITLFAVAKYNANQTYAWARVGTSEDSTYRNVLMIYNKINYDAYAGTHLQGGAIQDDTFVVLTALFKGASSYIRVNTSESAGNAGTNANKGIVIGADENAGNNYLEGDIAEYGMYDGELSSEDLDLLEAYLNTKYAIY